MLYFQHLPTLLQPHYKMMHLCFFYHQINTHYSDCQLFLWKLSIYSLYLWLWVFLFFGLVILFLYFTAHRPCLSSVLLDVISLMIRVWLTQKWLLRSTDWLLCPPSQPRVHCPTKLVTAAWSDFIACIKMTKSVIIKLCFHLLIPRSKSSHSKFRETIFIQTYL